MKKEFLLVPPNVWHHEDFETEFDESKLESWLQELKFPLNWDLAVMGVPENEQEAVNSAGRSYMQEYKPEQVYAEPSVLESLNIEGNLIEYSGEPSRAAVLSELEEIRDSSKNLSILTTDYNVLRTSFEASEKLSMDGLYDGYTLSFPDFPEMSVGPRKGMAAGAFGFLLDKAIGPERAKPYRVALHPEEIEGPKSPDFDYEVPELEQPCYLVWGADLDQDFDFYSIKMDEERFKHNRYPAFQELKDLAKKPARRVFDRFDF